MTKLLKRRQIFVLFINFVFFYSYIYIYMSIYYLFIYFTYLSIHLYLIIDLIQNFVAFNIFVSEYFKNIHIMHIFISWHLLTKHIFKLGNAKKKCIKAKRFFHCDNMLMHIILLFLSFKRHLLTFCILFFFHPPQPYCVIKRNKRGNQRTDDIWEIIFSEKSWLRIIISGLIL